MTTEIRAERPPTLHARIAELAHEGLDNAEIRAQLASEGYARPSRQLIYAAKKAGVPFQSRGRPRFRMQLEDAAYELLDSWSSALQAGIEIRITRRMRNALVILEEQLRQTEAEHAERNRARKAWLASLTPREKKRMTRQVRWRTRHKKWKKKQRPPAQPKEASPA